MVKYKFKMLLSILIISMLSITTISAAAGLNVILLNQNPDPVSPGNFVYLNVKMSNIGNENLKNAKITFNEDENFKLAQGEEKTRSIGTLSAYSSSDNTNSFLVEKFKIYVSDDTPSGLNDIKFDIDTSTGDYSYDFDVLVQDSNPQITIENIEIPKTQPGMSSNLKLKLKNENTVILKDVKVSLNLADVDKKVITLKSGSNEKNVGDIKAGNSQEVNFNIVISPEAESKPYLLPIKISYEDNLENSFNNTIYSSVQVYSSPKISLNLDSQDIYTIGKGEFSLAIANPGTSKIKGVEMTILESDDYEMIEGKNQYIGDMNPDDFQTLQGEIYIKNDESAILNVKLNYLDSYDNAKEEIIEIPLKIYNEEQLSKYGFKGTQTSINYTGYIIVIIITFVITFFFVRRSFKKKLKRRS